MENGFNFEFQGIIFENCFIHSSCYVNGNLQLSIFGKDPNTHQIAHFTDITLEQYLQKLKNNEIIVNCKFNPTLIPQLKELGILSKQIGIFRGGKYLYPIYRINLENCVKKQYYMQLAA